MCPLLVLHVLDFMLLFWTYFISYKLEKLAIFYRLIFFFYISEQFLEPCQAY